MKWSSAVRFWLHIGVHAFPVLQLGRFDSSRLALGVKLVTYPTRLETRTKEFSVYASQWAVKPRGAMKVNL